MKNKFNFLEFFQSMKSTLLVTFLLFTCVSVWGDKTDAINRTTISSWSTSYSVHDGIDGSLSDAVYQVYAMKSTKNTGYNGGDIQLRVGTSTKQGAYVVSTMSGGNIKSISIEWADVSGGSSMSNTAVDVYGSNTAFTGTDYYTNIQNGTKLGSISASGNAPLNVTGNYKYVGVVPTGPCYISSISFTWATGPSTYELSYAAGEGSGTGPAKVSDLEEGAEVILASNTFTAPSSKKFAGWNDGTSTYNAGAQYTMPASNVTMTAQWSAITYTDYITECGTDPFISVSPTSIDGLGYVYGSAASASTVKIFTVTGSYLTPANKVTIAAPSGFEVKADGEFADNVELTPANDGTLSATISVRLSSGKTVSDSYSGNVTISSDDISESKTVALSATVTPAQLATPVVTATPAVHQITLSWAEIANADSYSIACQGATIGDVAVSEGTCTCVLSGLTGGQSYTYNVKAIPADGDANHVESETAQGQATAGKATYAVTWYVNGSVLSTENVEEGAVATTPANPSAPAACSEKVFTGWTEFENYSSETTAPAYVSTPVTVTNQALNLYAVFADQGGEPEYYVKGSASDLTAGQVVVIHDYTQNVALTTEGYKTEKIPCVSVTPSNNKIPVTSITDKMKWTVGVVSGKYTFSQESNYLMAADWYLKFGTTNMTQWTLISMTNGYRFYQSDESDYPYINNDNSSKDITGIENSAAILNVFIPLASYSNYTTTCAKSDPELTGTAKTVAVDALFDVSTMFTSKSDGTITYSVTSEPESAVYELDGKDFLAETAGDYTIKANQAETGQYLADEATAVLTVSAKTEATLKLSAIGNEYDFEEDDLYVTKEITLPDDVEYKAANKTFVGWSSVAIPEEGDIPTTNYYAKGSKYTIAKAEDKLYAVYATETEGTKTWSVATTMTGMQAGDILAFACINDNNSVANGNKPDEKNFLDSVNITVANDIVTAGAEKIVPITLGGDAENGWNMNVKNLGYIYRSAKNEMGFKDTPTAFQSISIDGTSKEATVKVSGDSIVMYNSGSPRFSIYKSGQTAIKLLKAAQGAPTFSKYTTSGTLHVDAPTFDDDTKPGTYTDAPHLVKLNVPAGTSVYYTIDGTTEPTRSSTLYNAETGFNLSATATVKAKAFIEENASALLEGTFTIHNYNTVADLIAGAKHNKAAVLNMNEVFVLGVYSTAKQIFVQEGTKGVILTLKESVPENIVAGVKLSATASGTYIFTANNRPQLNSCILSNVSVTGENQRPASIPVLDKIDATTAADNLLTLVQINNVYSISKDGNDIVMNSASDESGTSFNVNNLLNAVYNTLPDNTLKCNVIGIFYKKIKNNVEEYSLVPVLKSDFALVDDAPDAVLPGIDVVGSTDSENPTEVAMNKVITLTRPDQKYTATYSDNGGEPQALTTQTATVTITNETLQSLTISSTRPYYNDNSVTYYYKANSALIEYNITLSSTSYVKLEGPASSRANQTVTITATSKQDHYTVSGVTYSYNDGEAHEISATSIGNDQYTFTMPAYPVTVTGTAENDPMYLVKYLKGGKSTTGTDPQDKSYYEGATVTVVDNPWTATGWKFKSWEVKYNNGTEDVIITPDENKQFTMPAFPVNITAQWDQTYTVTYDKGSATSATGSVTENPQIAGAVITVKANGFSAPGYTFQGWKASTDNQIYQPDDVYTMTAAAVTFTAQWDEPAYKKPGAWELVTDASKLAVGDYVIFAGAANSTWYAGTSNDNTAGKNLATVTTVSVTDDKKILSYTGTDITECIFQIEDGNEDDTYAFHSVKRNGYLNANGGDGSSNNYMTVTSSKASKNASWSVNSISSTDGEAVVKAKSSNRNQMGINTNTFAAYDKSYKLNFYKFYPTARKVYFNANAGEDVVTNMPEMERADATTNIVVIPDNTPERVGYTFSKWNSGQDGKGARSANPGDNLELWQAACTLYAQWTKNTPLLTIATVDHGTISAKPYGEDVIAEGGSANVEYNKSVVISHTDDDEQYAFKSWKIFKTDDEDVTITPTVGQTSTTFDMPDYPVTVSAIYEDKSTIEYTLTYDANGGEGTMTGNPFTKNWNNYITVSDNKNGEDDIFTKTNCTFTGWNTKEDGSGTAYAAGTHFYIKSDVTLYAQWKGTGVTYRLDNSYDGRIKVTVGAAPDGSVATYANTSIPSTPAEQVTQGKVMTITLSGYDKLVVKNIVVDLRTNGSNNNSLDISVGGASVFNKNYVELESGNNVSYHTRSLNDYGFYPFFVKDGENIVITVSSTNNSAFIQNITLEFGEGYSRTFTSYNVSTVCVPYAVKPEDRFGAAFYEIAYKTQAEDNESTKIYFDEVSPEEDLVAGKPYVIIPEKETMVLVYSGEVAEIPVAGNKGLTGTFTGIDKAATNDLNGNYIFNSNKYWLCGGNCWLDANRAYINKDAINADLTPVSPAPGRRRIVMGANGTEEVTIPDTPTDVVNVNANDNVIQKMIINNQVIIIRNGQMYNAQGALMK